MMSYQNNKPQLRFSGFEGEWKQKRLGEVSDFLDGRRKPIKSDDRSKMKGEYPYYGASGIIDYVNNYIFDEELILLGEDGENIISRNLPLAFRVSGKCWINNHAHVIVPKENTNIDFLTHNLERINYVVYNTGTAQPKLNQEVCRNIPSWFPTLPEQQKIASFLSAIDEKLQQLSRKKELLSQYKKGVMQQLFSGKLRFKDENGEDYPGWEEKLLGSLTERNICYGVVQPGIEDEKGVKFIRGGDVFNGCISRNLRVISKEITDNYKRTYLKGGELIMSLVGYPGETAIVPDYLKGSNLARQVGLIDLKKTTNSVYVHYYISSSYGKRNLLGKTIGSAQQVINIVDLKKLKIPLPSLLEQQKIAGFLSSIDAKIESTNQQLNETKSFKKGLLQQLLV